MYESNMCFKRYIQHKCRRNLKWVKLLDISGTWEFLKPEQRACNQVKSESEPNNLHDDKCGKWPVNH